MMVVIEEYDKQIEDLRKAGQPYFKANVDEANYTLFMAYALSREEGKSHLDISRGIESREVEGIVKIFREKGIKEFTISNSGNGIVDVLAKFEECGARMKGLTKVETNRPAPYGASGHEVLNAFRMEIE